MKILNKAIRKKYYHNYRWRGCANRLRELLYRVGEMNQDFDWRKYVYTKI